MIESVHISLIKVGDTVEHNGQEKTVCPKDITYGGFMGGTLFGDSYRCGTIPVRRVCLDSGRAL